ncbi:hypothetical protein UA08_06921 [Talaromyces atroroseus]|uniref:Zn(2)-C6 fungal-type domain-containing protein n=1 Tax=Talaromyces atroroseus TaxID=1441469 RepID=A0A225AQ59_TALAT|nr:hypothetical protein UA08_06921 [Talaromyces atroroseus]OKL57739.1 hypothetical protein UA08_06921 [Talaromyces atroroseus]
MLSPTAPSRTSPSPRTSPRLGRGKRQRKTLSCYECRRRKLRCDREEPSCGRCIKAGHPETCSYVYDALAVKHPPALSFAPKQPGARSRDVAPESHENHTSFPQPKVAYQFLDISGEKDGTPSSLQAAQNQGTWQLLGQMSDAEQRPAVKADADDSATYPRELMPKETVIFRGENFRTQYFGGSNATSSIAHFPELRTFMRETIRHQTALPRVQRDVKTLQVRWKGLKTDNLLPVTHEDLLGLLPDRDTADRHVRLYLDTIETTYRIVHHQSFYEQYELLWENPHEVKSASVVIVLLVMASVSCMFSHEHPKYIGDSSLSREKATFWIEVAEKWLSCQSDKHVYLAIWQIRCLVLLAKQINVIKKKRIWTAAGTLLREAMSSGFHRDPSLLGDKVSFFDQEMRRRLWATIIELELQISIDRGMPSASAGLPSDTATVLNVHDSELTKHGRPTSRPVEEHTSALYLHISRSSFSLRVSLNSLVNDLSSPLLYDQVLNYEDAITKELRKLPQVTEYQKPQDKNDSVSLMARTLLDIQLRQFLIMLHSPFARQAETNSRFLLSRVTCLNAAVEILRKYSYINKSGNLALLLLRNDPFRVALAICQTTYINISMQNNLILNSSSAMLIQYVEESLVMLESKITQHGTGYTYYWYISAASALLRGLLAPEEASREKEEAIGRVTRQYYRILAWQEDLVKARDMIVSVPTSDPDYTGSLLVPDALNDTTGLSILPGDDPQAMHMDMPLDEFFFGNPAAWTFENLWSID